MEKRASMLRTLIGRLPLLTLLTAPSRRFSSEERFRALIEDSSDGIAVVDAHMKNVYRSPSRKQILGYDADEPDGPLETVHPDDMPRIGRALEQIRDEPGATTEVQARLLTKQGEWRWFEVKGKNLFANPAVRGIVVNYRDITERKLAEQEIQRAHAELSLAYDTTLEGWSRALDLRDKETEGHTQRVTEGALRLARAMGIGEVELVHVRRGGLLHDIGKMGIPDQILHKPGPLTPKEWELMRMHTVFAYQLLSPIEYLRPALDIPYSHHEKWDGSGYPRGLQEEEIPLVARIFAVVDVWDALSSNRPYRRAWVREEVLNYIREQSGKGFDPRVVATFLEILPAA